jgi:excisionase family DNA binding protein
MTEILFRGTTEEAFLEKLEALIEKKQKQAIEAFIAKEQPEKLYTRAEACKFLSITNPTLHEWTKKGIIRSHKIGGRVYYKQSDIDVAISRVKRYQRN